VSEPFDFEPSQSRAYYDRPRRPGTDWVKPAIIVSAAILLAAGCIAVYFAWSKVAGPSPAVEGHIWTAEQTVDYLVHHGVIVEDKITVKDADTANAGSLHVRRFPDAATARATVANVGFIGFAWGRFVVVAPPLTMRQARAALGAKSPDA
jgi:hypothetical protein